MGRHFKEFFKISNGQIPVTLDEKVAGFSVHKKTSPKSRNFKKKGLLFEIIDVVLYYIVMSDKRQSDKNSK